MYDLQAVRIGPQIDELQRYPALVGWIFCMEHAAHAPGGELS
jgi:hypothetical protein